MDRAPMIAAMLMAVSATASVRADAPASASPDTSAIILAPKAPATPAVSPGGVPAAKSPLEAAMASSMPKYTPTDEHPAPALVADIKPKNEIPRLPLSVMSQYLVKGDRVRAFREQDLYTPKGLTEISFKNHPGLLIGNIFNLNAPIAYAMIKDEEERSANDDMKDTAYAFAVGGDLAEAKAILEATGETYMRDEDPEGPVHMK
jgi:hypothetical protein